MDKENGIENPKETPKGKNAVVTPWQVEGDVDYMKLVEDFGTELIDETLLEKFQRITGKELHPWLRRGIYFTHRGLHTFLDAYERGDPVFLYTGRGPSDGMHVGHLIPFLMTKWLQDVFDCPLIIQLSDDEKYAFKKLDYNTVYQLGLDNAKDIIACGFNPKKTFIFLNRDYRLNCRTYEVFVSDMKVLVSSKEVKKIFGFSDDSTVAMWDWPFYQSAAAFYQSFPHIFNGRPAFCLIPHAIDQDPYFRMARDLATRMNLIKPSSLMCTFIPPLTGSSGKMSSSVSKDSTLFLSDSEKVLREKIANCFSGGGGNGTLEEHRKYGGNPDADVAYQYLRYFEHDDDKLKEIYDKFKSGEMSCGEIKSIMMDKLIPVVKEVQAAKANVSQADMDQFFGYNAMELPKPKAKEIEESEGRLYEILQKLEIPFETRYQAITTTEEKDLFIKTIDGTLCGALFLKGPEHYYLYITNVKTIVNMKTLHKRIGISKIRFGENDTLTLMLKVTKHAVSGLSVINDQNKAIKILIDENIPKDRPVYMQPLRYDAYVRLDYNDLVKFYANLGYDVVSVKE